MARPSKFDANDAIREAMEAYWAKGYEANSVKSLSEMLGITRSSFYNAFGTREELFVRALEVYCEEAPDRALMESPHRMGVRRLITGFFRTVCQVRASDPAARGCLVVNAIAELCQQHSTLGPMLEKAVFSSLERIETLVDYGVKTGELDPELDVHGTALAVQNLMIGVNLLAKVVREESELALTTDTTLKGLGLFDPAG